MPTLVGLVGSTVMTPCTFSVRLQEVPDPGGPAAGAPRVQARRDGAGRLGER